MAYMMQHSPRLGGLGGLGVGRASMLNLANEIRDNPFAAAGLGMPWIINLMSFMQGVWSAIISVSSRAFAPVPIKRRF